jgi:hypothetical protein
MLVWIEKEPFVSLRYSEFSPAHSAALRHNGLGFDATA